MVRSAALILTMISVAGCVSSTPTGPDDWSRSYLVPYERTVESVLDALEAIDFYLVEVDGDQGKIRADASVRRGEDITLLVRVDERGSGVRVDVMARGANLPDGRASARLSAVVGEFLRAVDARIEGRAGQPTPHP